MIAIIDNQNYRIGKSLLLGLGGISISVHKEVHHHIWRCTAFIVFCSLQFCNQVINPTGTCFNAAFKNVSIYEAV